MVLMAVTGLGDRELSTALPHCEGSSGQTLPTERWTILPGPCPAVTRSCSE